MGSLVDTLVLSGTYNALPLISQVSGAAEYHSQDLQDLRELLHRHNVPKDVSIRLIHRHFSTVECEVMFLEKFPVAEHGVVQITKPVVPSDSVQLRGIHYLIDSNASLQAYEYSSRDMEAPDMSGLGSFLADFCSLVSERGLQRKFGLKLHSEYDTDRTGWIEFEFQAKRGTVLFPEGMPMPGAENDYGVATEWRAGLSELSRTAGTALSAGTGRPRASTASTASGMARQTLQTIVMQRASAWVSRGFCREVPFTTSWTESLPHFSPVLCFMLGGLGQAESDLLYTHDLAGERSWSISKPVMCSSLRSSPSVHSIGRCCVARWVGFGGMRKSASVNMYACLLFSLFSPWCVSDASQQRPKAYPLKHEFINERSLPG
ncbi:hypothetical protein CDD83_8292 [Cordyceps sp. RAO-2017]|nr:hypothetical protein CDD83_8292 [Cordyceps sp. RAO-2017]